MQLTRTLIAAAIAVAITAGIATGISNAQEPPPIPLPEPLHLEVTVTKVNDNLCVVENNVAEWTKKHIPHHDSGSMHGIMHATAKELRAGSHGIYWTQAIGPRGISVMLPLNR